MKRHSDKITIYTLASLFTPGCSRSRLCNVHVLQCSFDNETLFKDSVSNLYMVLFQKYGDQVRMPGDLRDHVTCSRDLDIGYSQTSVWYQDVPGTLRQEILHISTFLARRSGL